MGSAPPERVHEQAPRALSFSGSGSDESARMAVNGVNLPSKSPRVRIGEHGSRPAKLFPLRSTAQPHPLCWAGFLSRSPGGCCHQHSRAGRPTSAGRVIHDALRFGASLQTSSCPNRGLIRCPRERGSSSRTEVRQRVKASITVRGQAAAGAAVTSAHNPSPQSCYACSLADAAGAFPSGLKDATPPWALDGFWRRP